MSHARTGSSEGSRVVREFLDLVQVDSPSRHEAALAAEVERRFRSIGLELANDQSGPATGNLVGRLEATGPGPAILLTAHLDTVEPGRGVKPWDVRGLAAAAGLAALVAIASAPQVAAVQSVSTPFIGVTYIDRTLTNPRPIHMRIAQVDLGAPGMIFGTANISARGFCSISSFL